MNNLRKGGVKIIIKNFQKKIPIYPTRIKKTILKVLSQEKVKKSGEITVCFVSDRKLKGYNLRYLGKDKPTDVLAFNLTDAKDSSHIFADILISTDTAIGNAKLFKTTHFYELLLYVTHGVLHLLGYDDKTSRQRKIMQEKTCQYIKLKP